MAPYLYLAFWIYLEHIFFCLSLVLFHHCEYSTAISVACDVIYDSCTSHPLHPRLLRPLTLNWSPPRNCLVTWLVRRSSFSIVVHMICQGGYYCGEIRYELHLSSPDDARTSLCHCHSCKVCPSFLLSDDADLHWFYRSSLAQNSAWLRRSQRTLCGCCRAQPRSTSATTAPRPYIVSSVVRVAPEYLNTVYVDISSRAWVQQIIL